MFQLIYLVLKALGFINQLPAGIPMVWNMLPTDVTMVEWDKVMASIFVWNIVICAVIFGAVTLYYSKFFKIAGPHAIHRAWLMGFWGVFFSVYVVSVILTAGDLSNVRGLPANIGEIVFPVGFFMALDSALLYLVLSSFYAFGPVIVKGVLPPVKWFTK